MDNPPLAASLDGRLIGRQAEFGALRSAADSACHGGGTVVVVSGAAGAGKTRLIDEAVRSIEPGTMRILRGRVSELVAGRPFAAVLDALDVRAGSALYDLVHQRTDVSEAPLSSKPGHYGVAIDAFVDAIENTCREAPTVLCLDDLQWADDGSLAVLGAIAARAGDLPIAVIAALRPEPRSPGLAAMLDETIRQGGTDLVLGPLDNETTIELAAELIGAPPGPRMCATLLKTNGNPLFITELVRGVVDEALLVDVSTADGAVARDLTDDRMPHSLQRLIERRLRRVRPDTFELLRRASLLGSAFRLDQLAAIAGAADVVDLLPSIREARSHDLVADHVDGAAFRHDLVRDAVYDSINTDIRTAMHRDAAAALIDEGDDDLAAATQIVLAGPKHLSRLGDRAVDTLRRAAAGVVDGAPQTADRLLSAALSTMQPHDERRPQLVAELGRARFWSGDLTGTDAVIIDELDHDHPPELLVELLGVRAETLFITGRLEEAASVFEQLARSLDTAKAGHRLSEAATASLLGGRLDQAESLAEEAIQLSVERGSLAGACEARNTAGWVRCLRGDIESGLALIATSVNDAEAANHSDGDRTIPWLFLGQAHSWADDSPASLAMYARGRSKAAALGVSWYDPLISAAMSGELLQAGAWDDALAEAESIIAYSRDTQAEMTDAWAFAAIAQVNRRRGNNDAAVAALDAGRLLGAAGVAQGRDIITAEQARFQSITDPDGATDLLLLLWNILDSYGIALRMWEIAPDLVGLLLDAGRSAEAHEVCNRLGSLPGLEVGITRQVNAARCHGLVEGDPAPLRALATQLDEWNRPVLAAELHGTLAVVVANAAPDESRTQAQLAIAGFESVGATADVDNLIHRLDVLGVSVESRTESAPTGWELITASEHRVIARVCEGLTNGEIADLLFISRRTVESHLHHVYVKLGFSSRTELAVAALDQTESPTTLE